MTYRIAPHIIPFLRVTLSAPELPVPEIFLPKGLISGTRPVDRSVGFPILHPPFQRGTSAPRSAEQMQMFRHDDVAAHHPVIRVSPGVAQCLHSIGVRQNGFATRRAHREENNDGAVAMFAHRPMDRTFASRIFRLHDDAHNNFPMSRRAGFMRRPRVVMAPYFRDATKRVPPPRIIHFLEGHALSWPTNPFRDATKRVPPRGPGSLDFLFDEHPDC